MLIAPVRTATRRALILGASLISAGLGSTALAGPDDFGPGPLIEDYGPIAAVETSQALPGDVRFRVAFDTATRSEGDALNRTLTSAARFLNMHVAHGVDPSRLDVAVVIHGGAVHDVSTETAAGNAGLIAALREHGVRVIVCGQSAVYYDVTRDDLLPGVEMALSAMTVHALLQQDGYTLNPF